MRGDPQLLTIAAGVTALALAGLGLDWLSRGAALALWVGVAVPAVCVWRWPGKPGGA